MGKMFIILILIPSYMKTRWLISLYDKLGNSGEMIKNASIMEAIDNTEFPNEDPFKHLSE